MRDYYLGQMGMTPWSRRASPLSLKSPLCVVLWEPTPLSAHEEKLLRYILLALQCTPLDVERLVDMGDLVPCIARRSPQVMCALGQRMGDYASKHVSIPLVVTHDLKHMQAFPEVKRQVYDDLRQVHRLTQACVI